MPGVSSPARPLSALPSASIPEGTRDVLPPDWEQREALRARLSHLFGSWGYRGVEVPALEYADARHPQDARAFKLIDSGGQVLALRSEFTTAIGRLVRAQFADGPFPLRLHYSGRLWLRALTSELGRLREFGQTGVELIGTLGARADAELLQLAAAALAEVSVAAELEVGFPGFVDAVLEDAALHGPARQALHGAVDRKSGADIDLLSRQHGLSGGVTRTLHALTDLYGGAEVLDAAARLAQGTRARAAVAHLREVAALYGGPLLYDLGASRRYDYYTGLTFRAYAAGLNQPVLGGGRYTLDSGSDGGLPGAGFAMGLERLLRAAAPQLPPQPEVVLALDAAGAELARGQGLCAELAWTDDQAELRRYSAARGIRRWARGSGLFEPQVQA
ncbi:ATP phosphoribosyltransferase regulatory subunit [Deinococcus sp. D7000]|uniref:ATP phosphoribosyltransferase regulatory subunit n=1 Tax=Deinococcus radiopugnans ATCC 19172 TaxID=585398 RepID=A0A5C4Y9I6_9DEIO|nr:ATP phosphoribosyltransferase regulatory subunit [Deinococcus radiopugnans]QLG10159.1 ATP phosphoribosyltransferase regulatory subunit [Deinococcus sp. D7000]TNM72190.1 ATP phosphoribosyltransferase regulatory subunit [Deinococcus radiopugnans ATCC 19172]